MTLFDDARPLDPSVAEVQHDQLICERCGLEVLAVVNVADRSGPQWWCAECHMHVQRTYEEEVPGGES